VRPTAGNAPFLQRQAAGSQSQSTDLGLESPSYIHWRSFVVHSASGGVSPHSRHATAVDGDSDLPLPHTRDAITLLCSTAHDDN
jgi:hypothetical protein